MGDTGRSWAASNDPGTSPGVALPVPPKSGPQLLQGPAVPPEPPHPLQAGWPLFPPPPVALEKTGGAALLCGAAEPVRRSGRGARRQSEGRRCWTREEKGRVPYLLMVSSSSESPRLVLSSSLVMRVEELSYPARWRSSLEGPLGLWPPAACQQEPQNPDLALLTFSIAGA